MNKQLICKITLSLTDFISIFSAFLISFWLFSSEIYQYIPEQDILAQFSIHLILSIICVIWFWIRLRHYTYHKPFWSELKEVLRTVIIMAIIGLNIVAFSKLYLSRYIWLSTWLLALFLVPLARILVKKKLINTGLYIKNTIIIGNGKNAIDTF